MGEPSAPMSPRSLTVLAHVPPPLHGQSKMVELVLRILRQAPDHLSIFHVDARYSASTQDVGSIKPRKFVAALRYAVSTVGQARKHGARTLYYVPAPPRYGPLIRDIIVLLVCRPFYPALILHWQAAGLGSWIAGKPKLIRVLAQMALGRAALSIPLSKYSERDAEIFTPVASVVLPNAVDDPEPLFDVELSAGRSERERRLAAAVMPVAGASDLSEVPFNALFMGLLCEEKGVFDALRATVLLARLLKERGARVKPTLRVCGSFASRGDEQQFGVLMRDANAAAGYETVRLVGFVDGERKREELRKADCFVFPTFYSAENSPLVLIEAMASGVHVVTTRWRGVPEMLPADYAGIVAPRDASAVADAMFACMSASAGGRLRKHFIDTFGVQAFSERFLAAVMPVLDANSSPLRTA